jgi:hypothetical protein
MAAFTTIAAGIGLAATAGTTGASFAQASKQRKIQKKAEADAAKFMADARKKLDVNFYEQLGIQKEPYELAREAVTSTAAQAVEAGKESERGAAATAGRVFMGAEKAQRDIATQMGGEMQALDKLVAAEESRLRDVGMGLDLAEVEGAQLKAREAETRSQAATKQAMEGIVSMAGQLGSAAPLFEKTASAKQFNKLASDAQKAGLTQEAFQKQLAAFGANTPTFGQLAGVGAMDPMKFAELMGKFNPDYLKSLRQSFNPTGIYTQSIPGVGAIGPVE